MTKAELNRAVKRFAKEIKDNKTEPNCMVAHAEFNRLIRADISFKSFTANSLRILIVLNRRFGYIPAKDFGPADYE